MRRHPDGKPGPAAGPPVADDLRCLLSGRTLSSAAADALAASGAEVSPGAGLLRRLERVGAAAEADLSFAEDCAAGRRRHRLGDYVVHLRSRRGLDPGPAAQAARWDRQALADLERDALPVSRLRGRHLARLIRALGGSLDTLLRLAPGLLREPPRLAAAGHDPLFRGEQKGEERLRSSLAARGLEPETRPNPAWAEERRELARLLAAIRKAW